MKTYLFVGLCSGFLVCGGCASMVKKVDVNKGLDSYYSKNHRWRDQYNPLRGLSLPKLVSLLEAGERGAYADLQWFYHYMERSDAMIHAVIQRRRAALLACDWDIRLCPPEAGEARIQKSESRIQKKTGDQVLADEQAAFLREAYDRVENFRDAVSFMFSGFFRGYHKGDATLTAGEALGLVQGL